MRAIIPNTNVLDVVNCRTLDGYDIVLDGGLIQEVRPSRTFTDDYRVLRGGPDRWVIPGLIDAHVHLLEVHEGPDAGRLPDVHIQQALARGMENVKAAVSAGITTVRDVGAFEARNNILRDTVNDQKIPLARILSCGAHITVEGGHFCDRGVIWDRITPIETLVEEQISKGADFIKVMNDARIFDDRELKAIVMKAHDLGKHVACHAFTEQQIHQSILCGVDTIEHGYPANPTIAGLLKESSIALCPTIVAAADSVACLDNSNLLEAFPDCSAQEFKEWFANVSAHLASAFANDLSVIAGTDAGMLPTPFDSLHRELGFFAKHGASFWRILQSATITSARALGVADITGQITSGRSADLVVLKQAPYADLPGALAHIDYVVFNGEVVCQDGEKT